MLTNLFTVPLRTPSKTSPGSSSRCRSPGSAPASPEPGELRPARRPGRIPPDRRPSAACSPFRSPAAPRPPSVVLDRRPDEEVEHGDRPPWPAVGRWPGAPDRPRQLPRRPSSRRPGRSRARRPRDPPGSTKSPAAMAARPSSMARIASGSERMASVSSMASRSSALTTTTAGRPLRVTVTRSWVLDTTSTISENLAVTSESGRTCDMTRILVCNSPSGRSPSPVPEGRPDSLGTPAPHRADSHSW